MIHRQDGLHVCRESAYNLPYLGEKKMLKKLICVIFAACIVYTAVPAHALDKQQLQTILKQYIENTVFDAIDRECLYYNAQPPERIRVLVSSLDEKICGIMLDFCDGCDPRVVAVAADMVALESVNILNRLGISNRAMQQANFGIIVMPVTQNSRGKWVAYDNSTIHWEESTTPKLERDPAHNLQRRLDGR